MNTCGLLALCWPTSMHTMMQLALALAISAAILGSFALLRRTMHSPDIPRWLDNDPAGFSLGVLYTIIFAFSMFGVASALLPLLSSGAAAFCATVLIHILFWSVWRVLIPVGGKAAQAGITPAALPATVPAH